QASAVVAETCCQGFFGRRHFQFGRRNGFFRQGFAGSFCFALFFFAAFAVFFLDHFLNQGFYLTLNFLIFLLFFADLILVFFAVFFHQSNQFALFLAFALQCFALFFLLFNNLFLLAFLSFQMRRDTFQFLKFL